MANAAIVNFAGGETSPKSRGRFDIASYNSSCRKLINFISEVSGPARFRPGFKRVANTRGDAVARLIPFQFNDAQAYMLEFTPGKMRVYVNGALKTVARTTVTGIDLGATTVVHLTSATGLSNGDDVIITGLVGATWLNGRQVRLAGGAALTFRLTDPVSGADIVSTSLPAWSSGGDVAEIYEIASPYLVGELDDIFFAQTIDAMYLDHYGYTARKITVDSGGAFVLDVYTRTNDPFGVGSGNLTVVDSSRITYGPDIGIYLHVTVGVVTAGAVYTLSGCEEDAEINGNSYKLEAYINPGYFKLLNATTGEVVVPGSGAYIVIAGGVATPALVGTDNPICPAFYENRLAHAGTNVRPRTLFLSMAPVAASGLSRFETFTGGTAADNACFFSLAPVNGSVDYIAWAGGTSKYLLIGTFGGVFRVSGGGIDEPITPSSINVKQIDAFGCAPAAPALNGNQAFFIQRGGVTLRGVQYSLDADDLTSVDMCQNADQIAESPLRRVVLQTAKPDALWVTRDDGVLCGMTVQGSERVAGWHRHKIGGTAAKVIDIAVLPRPDAPDQLYIVAERTINGITRRSVEIMTDDVVFPDPEDFYTGEDNFLTDRATYRAAVYRRQEQYIHVDSAMSYDGSDRGVAAAATLTPAAGGVTLGASVVFTASAAVFTAADVGKQLWKKPNGDTGVGAGRATITAYSSTTQVTATITEVFDSVSTIAAGDWYFAVSSVSGLSALEGENVAVLIDGAVHADGVVGGDYETTTIANGVATLLDSDDDPVFAAVVHIGLPYEGFLQTQNLEIGGRSGPAQTKPRNICEFGIRFLNSLGCEYGTNLYKTEKIVHRDNTMVMDRPIPVFSGIRKLPYADNWSSVDSNNEKNVIIVQRLPLPCTVQFVDIQFETGDE